jgi:hypothetical protein
MTPPSRHQEQETSTMSNQTRTITREQLEEWGLPHDLAEEQDAAQWPGIAVEVHREQTDTRRWYSRHLLVFRAPDDGQLWGVTYNQGLTEVQEDTDPWNEAAEVTAYRMEQYEKTVTAWRKVGEAS